MNDENKDTILKIFCEALGVPESDVSDETAYDSFETWDSLKHLQIVSEIEEEFDIDIEMDDVIAMDTFKKISKIVEKYLDKEVDE